MFPVECCLDSHMMLGRLGAICTFREGGVRHDKSVMSGCLKEALKHGLLIID